MFGLLNAASDSFAKHISSFFEFAKEAFLNFDPIIDTIDILLLTLFFTFIFKFIINKKAGALILGIFVCFAILLLSVRFGLTGTQHVLSWIFQIGAIAIVIIFQPEIRELLEKVGAGSINSIKGLGDNGETNKMQYKSIDAICKAVQILSMQKTGALIVISRNMSLDEWIHSGTELNSDVSDSLIRNIFYDKAPLHDGAMIIDNGRIAAAACILPLTKRTTVEKDLGTRHRAAIGLTETTDAIVVVVSEETGIVSVAMEAELTRNYTSDTLRKRLISELIRGGEN